MSFLLFEACRCAIVGIEAARKGAVTGPCDVMCDKSRPAELSLAKLHGQLNTNLDEASNRSECCSELNSS